MNRFAKFCEKLFDQLSAVDVLSLDRDHPTRLSPRGRRLLDYLRARRRRAYLDSLT